MDLSPSALRWAVLSTKASVFASVAFLWYDYLITLDSEIEFIWTRRWSLEKLLFIFNRYFGLCTLLLNTIIEYSTLFPTMHFCESLSWFRGAMELTAIINAQIVLQARIYEVYNRSKKLLFIMAGLSVPKLIATLLILGVGMPDGVFEQPIRGLAGCWTPNRSHLYFLCMVPTLLFESFLGLLMLYQTWIAYKDENRSLLKELLHDSSMYFLPVYATVLINCLIWALAPDIIGEVASGWLVAVPCVLGSHLLLNMRERKFNKEIDYSSTSDTTPLWRAALDEYDVKQARTKAGISVDSTSFNSAQGDHCEKDRG